MYVDDIVSMEELEELEDELIRELSSRAICGGSSWEQLEWDLEDVHRRMQEIDPTEGTL